MRVDRASFLGVSLVATVLAAACSGSSGGDGGTGGKGGEGDGGSGSSSGGVTVEAGASSSGAADGGGGGGGADAPVVTDAGACSSDPLKTGLTAQQTGVSVDAFDCPILAWTAKYAEPDPMIFKAIIYVESRFDDTSVACPNMPCGTPSGWTTAESGCYGLMQVVPACGDDPDDAGLLANGQPNLTTDPTASGWATSIFNPEVNIEIGISGVAGNRAQEEAKFPGCTVDQYTLMAVGDYNSYGSTKSCTVYNTAYDDPVVAAYQQYAAAAGYAAHAY
ncbi:MAG TPA: transglycosylase SLT domain-containing protein [Polyangiaceae bacterium]